MPHVNKEKEKKAEYYSEDESVEATQSPVAVSVVREAFTPTSQYQSRDLVPDSNPGTPGASQMSDTGCTQFVNAPFDKFVARLNERVKNRNSRKEQQEQRVGSLERPGRVISLGDTFSRMSPAPGPSRNVRRSEKRAREVARYDESDKNSISDEDDLNDCLRETEADDREEDLIETKKIIKRAINYVERISGDLAIVTTVLNSALEKIRKMQKK